MGGRGSEYEALFEDEYGSECRGQASPRIQEEGRRHNSCVPLMTGAVMGIPFSTSGKTIVCR